MELRQLEYFVAVANEQSYGRAAKMLNISQPAISRQIQLLEEELNAQLFDPVLKAKHKKIILTEFGDLVLQEAEKMLNIKDNIKESLNRIRDKRKILKLGVYQLLPKSRILKIIRMLSAQLPDFDIRVLEYRSFQDVLEAIRNDEILMGVTFSMDDISGFNQVVIDEGVLQVVLREEHPLAGLKYLRIRQLKNEKWIEVSHELTNHRNTFAEIFKRNGIMREANVVQVVSSFELLMGMIGEGYGIGLTPSFYDELPPGMIKKNLYLGDRSNEMITCKQLLVFKNKIHFMDVEKLGKKEG